VPEGDTIHRVADRLRPVLAGRPLVRLELPRTPGPRPAPGTVIDAVDAVGKHLLIRFADGRVLRTHLRMTGSWHLYRTGERWRLSPARARAVIEVEGWVAVCFNAPTVELTGSARATGSYGAAEAARGLPVAAIAHLGPDLAADPTDADVDAAAARMATHVAPDTEIGVVLLDQRIACGVGNVYKSETLFACGVDPFTPVGELDQATRRHLIATASKQLRANLAATRRTTVPGGLAVYGRRGLPCRRCGTPIRARKQGEQARTTYWCPQCQAPPTRTQHATEQRQEVHP
jgi:endonuclease-8